MRGSNKSSNVHAVERKKADQESRKRYRTSDTQSDVGEAVAAMMGFQCRSDCSKSGAQPNCLVQLCFQEGEEDRVVIQELAEASIRARKQMSDLSAGDTKRKQEDMVREAGSSSSASSKVKRTWRVFIGEISYSVCVRSMEYFHGFAAGALDTAAAFVKSNAANSAGSVATRAMQVQGRDLHEGAQHFTVEETSKNFLQLQQEFGDNLHANDIKKLAPASMQAVMSEYVTDDLVRHYTAVCQMPAHWVHARVWTIAYAKNYGNSRPNAANGEEVWLSEGYIKQVWQLYVKQCKEGTMFSIDYKDFLEMWKLLPIKVYLQHFCGQLGKCWECGLIANLGAMGTEQAAADAKRLHEEHKTYYGSAREAMAEREEFARQHPDEVFCIDVDIAAQGVFTFPWIGLQSKLKDTINSHLLGILEINKGLSIFHFYDTVPKGRNLVIHCILEAFNSWVARHGHYPKYFYLNVDGGSENANAAVLLFCELLVAKRMVTTELIYSRNPTGHTHGPLDGRFSNIKDVILFHKIYTLDELERILTQTSRLVGNTTFHRVHVVADYEGFLEPFGTDIHLFCNMEWTVLQWRFQAVTVSPDFPLGVKTMWRAHPAEHAVEIERKEPSQCLTAIGKRSGIEAVPCYYNWWPLKDTNESRMGVEGFHLLLKMPHGRLKAYPIPTGAAKEVNAAIACLTMWFGVDNVTTKWWRDWRERIAPINDSVEDYVRRDGLPCFFRDLLEDRELSAGDETASFAAASAQHNVAPTLAPLVALACPFVRTKWNRAYVPSRVTFLTDPDFATAVTNFRNFHRAVLGTAGSKATLEAKLKRIATIQGEKTPTGNMEKLREAIFDAGRRYVQSLLGPDADGDEAANGAVTKWTGGTEQDRQVSVRHPSCYVGVKLIRANILREDIAALRVGNPLNAKVMDVFVKLLNMREARIVRTAANANPPREYQRCVFVMDDFLLRIQQGHMAAAAEHLHGIDIMGCYGIGIVYRNASSPDDVSDNWSAFFVKIATRSGVNIVPSYSSSDEESERVIFGKIPSYVFLINKFFQHMQQQEGQPPPPPFIQPSNVRILDGDSMTAHFDLQTDFDAGIAVITMLDLMQHDLPVYIKANQWQTLRQRLKRIIYVGHFPHEV